jgi:hypothetical protein
MQQTDQALIDRYARALRRLIDTNKKLNSQHQNDKAIIKHQQAEIYALNQTVAGLNHPYVQPYNPAHNPAITGHNPAIAAPTAMGLYQAAAPQNPHLDLDILHQKLAQLLFHQDMQNMHQTLNHSQNHNPPQTQNPTQNPKS